MRQDIKRIKASRVQVGDVVCFFAPDRSADHEVWSIYKRMDGRLVFNEGKHGLPVLAQDYVFVRLPYCEAAPVESLPVGEYVKRQVGAQKVYIRAGYDRSRKAYQLDDAEDCNRCLYVKKGTSLFFGFTY